MALSGIEGKLRSEKEKQRDKEQINVIAYADDFIVTAASKELLETIEDRYHLEYLPKSTQKFSWR